MTCPSCGYEHLRPYAIEGPIRFYHCWRPECGHEFQTIERIYHPDAAPLARDILKSRVAFHGEIRGILEAEE